MATKEEQYREALSAIQDEVLKLLSREDLPEELDERLGLLESICRHGIDVRSPDEIKRR